MVADDGPHEFDATPRVPLLNAILATIEDSVRVVVRSIALVTAIATVVAITLHPGGSHWSTEKRVAVALSDLQTGFALSGLGICFFLCLLIAAQPRERRLSVKASVCALLASLVANVLFVPRI
jgi:hypothetical protein